VIRPYVLNSLQNLTRCTGSVFATTAVNSPASAGSMGSSQGSISLPLQGKPMGSAFIQSFNRTPRSEWLTTHWFSVARCVGGNEIRFRAIPRRSRCEPLASDAHIVTAAATTGTNPRDQALVAG
jgi:hypothetical protein